MIFTHIYLFNHKNLNQSIEVSEVPEEIVATINRGNWACYFPVETEPLFATQQGSLVIVTRSEPKDSCAMPSIPERELKVLQMLVEGMTAAQIAYRLGLQPRTVRGYVASLKIRLDSQTGQQLTAKAVGLGLLNPNLES